MAVRADHVELRTEDGALRLVALLGEESPQLNGGVGGWEAVTRPGRRPLTVWRGVSDPLTLTVALMLDGFATNTSVEDPCRTLQKMGGLDNGDPEPDTIIVKGALPHQEGRRWVIQSLEWGDSLRQPFGRVRQAVTVTLMLFTEADRLNRVKRSAAKRVRFVHARAGDTFEKIAARELKARKFGNRLAKLNGKRSADFKLKTGAQVKLPTAEALKAWKKGK